MISLNCGDIKSQLQKPNVSVLSAAAVVLQNLNFYSTGWNVTDWFWATINAMSSSHVEKFLCPTDVTPSMHPFTNVADNSAPAVA